MSRNDLQNAKTIGWFDNGTWMEAEVDFITKPASPWTIPVVVTKDGRRVKTIDVLTYCNR